MHFHGADANKEDPPSTPTQQEHRQGLMLLGQWPRAGIIQGKGRDAICLSQRGKGGAGEDLSLLGDRFESGPPGSHGPPCRRFGAALG